MVIPGGGGGGGAPPAAEDDEGAPEATLKPLRRFWADDLRRIAGRWASEMGAMDMMGLNAAMADVPCAGWEGVRGNLARREN